MEFVNLKAQYETLKQNIDTRIQTVLNHGQFILGPEVRTLEEALANYVGVKHCITVANCTDALLISLMALGVGPGDEIITTPFSFIATVEMILLLGAKPVFVDIDPQTYNMDPSLLEAAITSRTKAISPVNLFGQCADYDPITAIANRCGIPVLEDAGQSFGATYKGRASCSLATISCTSFFPSKPLGCYGDGGACFTDDDQLAEQIRRIRNHGQEARYHHVTLGLNSRLATLQAAILLAKLEALPNELKLRNKVANKYDIALGDAVMLPYIEPHNSSAYAQYTIQVSNRDYVKNYLQREGIPTAIHYPTPIHKQPILQEMTGRLNFPVAEQAATRVISLPFHPYLDEKEISKVVQAVQEAIS